jgi:RNA polymerase primary sigma factor
MSNIINQELANFYKSEDLPPLLSIEEEHSLASKIRASEGKEKDNALEKLITSNLLLVIRIAQSYGNCLKGNGSLGIKDLVNEGNMGLMIAAKKFDPNKSKFSTYASFWIRQSMVRALCNKSRAIRLPINLVQKSLHVFKFIDEYKELKNKEPSLDQISEGTGIRLSIVERILCSNYQFVNLDAPILDKDKGGSSRTIGDAIEDVEDAGPFKSAESRDNVIVINKVLNRLKPREKYIIEHRFGLNDKDVKTLGEIGELYSVTRERIRQIEFDTMKKLRFALTKEYKV